MNLEFVTDAWKGNEGVVKAAVENSKGQAIRFSYQQLFVNQFVKIGF